MSVNWPQRIWRNQQASLFVVGTGYIPHRAITELAMILVIDNYGGRRDHGAAPQGIPDCRRAVPTDKHPDVVWPAYSGELAQWASVAFPTSNGGGFCCTLAPRGYVMHNTDTSCPVLPMSSEPYTTRRLSHRVWRRGVFCRQFPRQNPATRA